VRAQVNSPTYLAGVWDSEGSAGVHPARLAWGLAEACERIGVRIAERTPATGLASDADGVTVRTRGGVLRARRVALGTNAFPPLVRRLRPYIVPVYDYVLVTEPLSPAQLAAVGWQNRQGVGDSANQFHYYRLTPDNRILWGGYDAIYHFGGDVRRAYDQRPATFAKLASHFFATFPQLEGIGFSHRWGGAIDTCSRFCAFFGTAHRGRVAYALGYTGAGGRRDPVRRAGDARPAQRRADRADPARDGPVLAAAVPARTARLPGRPGDPLVAGPGGPEGRAQEPVAPRPGRGGRGLMSLLSGYAGLLRGRSGLCGGSGGLSCTRSTT
jgi:FAD dependent oxidoreductase